MKKSRLAAMSATLLLALNLDAQNDNLELITLDSSYSATSCFIYNPNIGIIANDKNISVEADTLKFSDNQAITLNNNVNCLLYTSPSPRDVEESRMPSSA